MSHAMLFRRSAFSLIEVLISIVILALGLLGLAAVFPVVINQQRQASDAVQGVSLERSVEEYLERSATLNDRPDPSASLANPANRRGWTVLLAEPLWSNKGEWYVPDLDANALAAVGLRLDPVSGWLFLGEGGGNTIPVPLGERLTPSAMTSASDPRFVWDIAARRIRGGANATSTTGDHDKWADDSIQVSVFIRRVDSAIRLRGTSSLAEAFGLVPMNIPSNANRRVPVAVDARGRPTSDGYGGGTSPVYSPVRSFSYEFPAPEELALPELPSGVDVIIPDMTANFDDARPFVAQVGQKFVDQRGQVHEVIEVYRSTFVTPDPLGRRDLRLRVNPPVPSTMLRDAEDMNNQGLRMLYTPQTPAAVTVTTIQP
ncbi:MAG: hypothetical protein HBSAPP03_29210 [Phycisphaerae bacterium]|nr:MAG: hypothetical protein HBSAPP03_29210 [Phycisphaerae bacterium]